MLIAHAPAGYLLTRILSRTLFSDSVQPQRDNKLYRLLMFAGIIGAVFPDFDFFYNIFIDSDHTPHHAYLTHLPIFWLALWAVLFAVGRRRFDRRFTVTATIFCGCAMLHLVLDTLTGVIYWLAPFSHAGVNVFKVADVHIWWVRNYTDHWTFIVEIIIIAVAMIQFLRVKETLADMVDLFRRNGKIRAISVRLAVCALGLGFVFLVGSLKFNLNERIVNKAKHVKHYIERLTFSS